MAFHNMGLIRLNTFAELYSMEQSASRKTVLSALLTNFEGAGEKRGREEDEEDFKTPRDKVPKKASPGLPVAKGTGKGGKRMETKRKLVDAEEEETIELDDEGSEGEKAGTTTAPEKPRANTTVESALE
eukprot:1190137-Rhodomonas_salina.1